MTVAVIGTDRDDPPTDRAEDCDGSVRPGFGDRKQECARIVAQTSDMIWS